MRRTFIIYREVCIIDSYCIGQAPEAQPHGCDLYHVFMFHRNYVFVCSRRSFRQSRINYREASSVPLAKK